MQLREPGMLTQDDVVDRVAEDIGQCPPQFERHPVARAHCRQTGFSDAAALRLRRFLAAALGLTGRGAAFRLPTATGRFARHFAFDGFVVFDRGERCHFGNGEGCFTRGRFLHLLECRRRQSAKNDGSAASRDTTRADTFAGIAERR